MENAQNSLRQTRRGFTLIELLVVIAIIAILAAILFPVFAKVRENARKTTCLSNKKQIVMGLLQYVQDSEEQIPFDASAYGYRDPNPAAQAYSWQDMVYPYVKSEAAYDCPDDPFSSNNTDANGNFIADFSKAHYIYYLNLKTAGAYNYGSDSITLGYNNPVNQASGTPAQSLTSHAPCHTSPGDTTNDWGCIQSYGGIDAPSSTAWFMDGTYLENPQWCSLCITPQESQGYNMLYLVVGFHTDRYNVAYCDGHVKSISAGDLTKLSKNGSNTYAIFTTEDD